MILKFSFCQTFTFWDIATLLLWRFGLKLSTHSTNLGSFGGIYSPNYILHRPKLKTTVLAVKHVVRSIKRENRWSGWTCIHDREKKIGQNITEKSQNRYNLPIWAETPRERSQPKCAYKIRYLRCNHPRQVLK